MDFEPFRTASGPSLRRGRERVRGRGDGVEAMPHRLDDVDAAAREPTRLVRESRSCRDGVVPTGSSDGET